MTIATTDRPGERVDTKLLGILLENLASHLAHEFRTPLSSILLWNKLLSDGPASDPPLWREGLETIEASVHEQEALINRFVDLASILTGKVKTRIQEVNPVDLLEEIARDMQPAITGEKLRLELALDPDTSPLLSDGPRLAQALHHLLANALKQTPPGGRILLQLKGRSDEVEIQVYATGEGMNAKELDHVFEPLPPGQPPDRLEFDLPVARCLVELLQGTIAAESAGPGQGSTFTIRLPRIGTRRPEPAS